MNLIDNVCLQRKNRTRDCILALRQYCVEIYKNQKEMDACKPARHMIDLRIVFNVCAVVSEFGVL